MAYDSVRGVTVLFGGLDANYHNDETWEWNGTSWTLKSSTGPSARHSHAMAYDDANGVTVLFGGEDESFLDGETWEWDGTTWTLRSSTGPSPRANHAMAYDSARGVTVLFGGEDASGLDGETWEWTRTCALLRLTFVKGNWGSVDLDPNDPNFPPYTYPLGTEVTLTASPIDGKGFKHWQIYDPNYPGDANYAILDGNLVTTIVMDSDRGVTAVFKCGSSIEPLLPMMLGALGVFVWVRRRA